MGLASYLALSATQLTVTFAAPVSAVGFYTADLYNPFNDDLILSVYSGPNATGTLLGQYVPPRLNFQLNNIYFIGAVDNDNTIGSAELNAVGFAGDTVYLDKIVFASVPEPSSFVISGLGALGLLSYVWRCRTARPNDSV